MTYRIAVEVEHSTREESIEAFEAIVAALKIRKWPEESTATTLPRTIVTVTPVGLTDKDRITRIENVINTRMGGLS